MLIKLKGRNILKQKRKLPKHIRLNAYSLKGAANSKRRTGVHTGFKLLLTVKLAIISINSIKSDILRTI